MVKSFFYSLLMTVGFLGGVALRCFQANDWTNMYICFSGIIISAAVGLMAGLLIRLGFLLLYDYKIVIVRITNREKISSLNKQLRTSKDMSQIDKIQKEISKIEKETIKNTNRLKRRHLSLFKG